jgi:hypothetical protein
MLKRPCSNEQQAQDLITQYIRFLTKYNQGKTKRETLNKNKKKKNLLFF